MTWTTPANWAATNPTAANLDTYFYANLVEVGPGPWQIPVDVYATATYQTNWSTVNRATSVANGAYMESTGAQYATLGWDLVFIKGTWKALLIHRQGSDVGQYSLRVDGLEVATFDGYASAHAMKWEIGNEFTVEGTGVRAVKLVMADKNVTASSYYGRICDLIFTRTS